MSFWAGFGDAFATSYENAIDRKERRDILLGEQAEKRKNSMAPLKAKSIERLSEAEEQKAMLKYLEGRQLDPTTLNALLDDPETLAKAYEFARTEGADIDSKALNEIYRTANLGELDESQNAFERLESTMEVYRGVLQGTVTDPDTFYQTQTPKPRTAAVEVRAPVKPDDAGLTAQRARTYELQKSVYEGIMSQVVNTRLNQLNRKKDESGLNEDEARELIGLEEDFSQYGKDFDATSRLQEKYDSTVRGFIKNNPNFNPDDFAYFDANPLIYQIGSEAASQIEELLGGQPQAPQPTATDHTPPSGGVLIGQGIDPSDNVMTYFYQMPDGTTQQVKG